jgi:hypothetical protein
MADNRYLEVIKRLLTAETYLRWREKAKAGEPKRQPAQGSPKTGPS